MQVNSLPRSTPEAQGIARSSLDAFFEAASGIQEIHSAMVLRHGHVIAEGWWAPYSAERPHMLFSLSKSFTATAIGLLQAEGALNIEDRVLRYFEKEAPESPNEHVRAMRIKDLLTMSSGHDTDTLGAIFMNPGQSWSRSILAHPVMHAPGTHFVYNSGATYLLAVIVQRVSGQTLLDYLRPRLLTPLGILGGTWESCPEGINVGGWGLNLTTEDIARFGQLFLQSGVWQGKQIVPAEWVAAASTHQIDNKGDGVDWNQGYGYQFWRAQHNGYRGDGAFGQFCVVLPDNDAVIVATSGVENMQSVLDIMWQHLVPAFGPAALPDAGPYPAKKLALNLPQGGAQNEHSRMIAERTYTLETNARGFSALKLECTANGGTLTITDAATIHVIPFGHASCVESSTLLNSRDGSPMAIAAAGAWTDARTHAIKIHFLGGPFCLTVVNHFEGTAVSSEAKLNLTAFGDSGFSVTGTATTP